MPSSPIRRFPAAIIGTARQAWHSARADFARRRVLALLGKLPAGGSTAYYERLAAAVRGSSNLQRLREVRRTLRSVDPSRAGRTPQAGPPVSVVMPVYNRESVVADAIRSVLAQSHTAFELLICEDGSSDGTPAVLQSFADPRIRLLRHPNRRGAAAARNACLGEARGDLVAYLDSDNLWHPRFLELVVEELEKWPGAVSAYASYFDVELEASGAARLKGAAIESFDCERQIKEPFVDLNSFVHRRELVDAFGAFDEWLTRRQDYDLIVRYSWGQRPRHVPFALNIYQRAAHLAQITTTMAGERSSPAIIADKIGSFYRNGLPARLPPWLRKMTIVSWDMSRNHFAKAFSVAEALSKHLEVQLLSFRFFEEPIFPPLAGVQPTFEVSYFDGSDFPRFFETMGEAIASVGGDAIYAVKPRLPSFGLALLANHATGSPIFLEANDLETVVASPERGDRHAELPLSALLDRAEEARAPHAPIWSQALDGCVGRIPTLFTHNENLNAHYGRRCLTMRNVKDPAVFDPAKFDRAAIRAEIGFSPADRVILFGGLVRRHKGVFELAEFVRRLGAPYRLLVVASRDSPDLQRLASEPANCVTILPPQPPERMAALNAASDLVVLWLDPSVPASHFQNPYKLTDALAMGPAIVASPIADFPALAERGIVRTAPFGDFDRLAATIREIFADGPALAARRERARKLFLREYSYNAVLPGIALAASMLKDRSEVYPVSIEFAEVMAALRTRLR